VTKTRIAISFVFLKRDRVRSRLARDRKPRADAQRNRERILDVARREFSRSGVAASLEEIARKAAVGPGTLYRHFPTREALLVAVYRSEMEKLAAAERSLAERLSPVEALRAWLLLFIDAVETKQIIAPVLNTLVGDPKKVFEASYGLIHEAIRALVARAIKSGDMRKDLDPIDLLRALVGVANLASGPDWRPSARRLVDILIAGARPIA
jgi:AcrR family transcriptional regulator